MDRVPARILSACARAVTAVLTEFLEGLTALHSAGQLRFFGDLAILVDANAFAEWLAPFRKTEWVVYAKPPFGGPEAVLAYLSR